jgi:hypothetical protein
MSTMHARKTIAVLLFAVAASFLVLAGCAKKEIPTAPEPAAETVQTIKLSAERAMRAQDYKRAETLYRNLLDRPGLTPEIRAQAWRGLAESALHAGHYRTALDALENLARVDPSVRDTWDWHENYIEVLRRLDRPDQIAFHLKTLVGDPDRPTDIRIDAGLSLARDQWSRGEYPRAMQTLRDVYALFEDPADRAGFEAALSEDLKETGPEVFRRLAGLASPENEDRFPYSVIRLEQARRLARDPETWPRAWRILSRLARAEPYAGPNLAARLLDELTAERGRPGGGVALVLPLSGAYSEIGWNIARGAGAAQWEMVLSGARIDIRLINSESPDLVERIESLSPSYAVVGGPLRNDVFSRIESAGLTSARPFFTFLSGLPEGREGRDAWRFFSSPADEIDTLMDLAVERLDVRRLAVLHPEEPFGYRMTEMFREEVARRAGSYADNATVMADSAVNATRIWAADADEPGVLRLGIAAEASYPPDDPTKWGKSVAGMLGAPARSPEEGEPPLPPEPMFEAVFLPDNWSHAELLIPHFYFYEEDRLLFLGPALWGQGLRRDRDVETRYFRLSVFPGAFHAESDSPGAQKLRRALDRFGVPDPGFWTALGYDFVRFASGLGEQPAGHDPESVNEILSSAPDMEWSMAPIVWDEQGRASQDLFLFRPDDSGLRPVDSKRLYRRMVHARDAHERRVEKLKKKRELEKLRRQMRERGIEPDAAGPPVERNLSPEEREVQRRFRNLLESLEQRETTEQP